MSKLFFDHLAVFEEIEGKIDSAAKTAEEREELWAIMDALVHHKALGFILDKLPQDYHNQFLEMFHKAPHDEAILDFLKDKIGENFEELLRAELGNLAFDVLADSSQTKK